MLATALQVTLILHNSILYLPTYWLSKSKSLDEFDGMLFLMTNLELLLPFFETLLHVCPDDRGILHTFPSGNAQTSQQLPSLWAGEVHSSANGTARFATCNKISRRLKTLGLCERLLTLLLILESPWVWWVGQNGSRLNSCRVLSGFQSWDGTFLRR